MKKEERRMCDMCCLPVEGNTSHTTCVGAQVSQHVLGGLANFCTNSHSGQTVLDLLLDVSATTG